MEQWAKDWLESERAMGKKCLEIKTKGSGHYVYYSTTHWDKVLKKRVKTSKYLGTLKRGVGLVRPNSMPKLQAPTIRSITEYGNSMLLRESIKDLRPVLEEAFPDNWKEIYALSLLRVTGNVPLKRAKDSWEKLYNPDKIEADLTPVSVSKTLREVGVDRLGQDMVFQSLLDHSEQLVYDLTAIFSRSMSILQAEKGYNKDRINLPQINLALLCSADTGMPTMIRSLPGSVKDIKSLYNTLREIDLSGKILVLDRGFFSEDVISELNKEKIDYVLPTRRNSTYYDTRIHLSKHFVYHKRLIKCGRRKLEDRYIYLYRDKDLELEETKTLYRKLDEGIIDRAELDERSKVAGKILIVSSLDLPEIELFELFKKRERVEKMFDSYKNVLDADRLYLQDDESVFGHVFVSFLSLYIYCKIESMLKKAKLSHKMSPVDLLLQYSKVYHIELGTGSVISEVPKKVMDLDKALGLNVFSTEAKS
jgi:transposase